MESGGLRASLGIGGLKRDGRGGLRHGRGEGGHRSCSRMSERLGALGMEEVRRHPWFTSFSWKGEKRKTFHKNGKKSEQSVHSENTEPLNRCGVFRIKIATLEAAFSARYKVELLLIKLGSQRPFLKCMLGPNKVLFP